MLVKFPTILGIESSCDDTAIAIVKNNLVLSNIIYSQKIHEIYNGIVPEIASRLHDKNIVSVLDKAIFKANINQKKIDAVAFTICPGLIGSLLVGASFAKSISIALDIPIISVNHIQAHILVHFIKCTNHKKPNFPYLCLMISGGNTYIIKVENFFKMQILGETLDDAIGETLDKIGKYLGLKYPGAKFIDFFSKKGNHKKFEFSKPKVKGLNFSFSGFKTKILFFIKKKLNEDKMFVKNNIKDLCASIQNSIIEILIEKIVYAVKTTKINRIALAGGVASNYQIRKKFNKISNKNKWILHLPDVNYTTDNAAMIAMVGQIKYMNNLFGSLTDSPYTNILENECIFYK